jgi:hypothetical protein
LAGTHCNRFVTGTAEDKTAYINETEDTYIPILQQLIISTGETDSLPECDMNHISAGVSGIGCRYSFQHRNAMRRIPHFSFNYLVKHTARSLL